MDKLNIIKKSKQIEEDREGISLKLPVSLKKEVQDTAKEVNVTMNTLITETLKSMVNNEAGTKIEQGKKIIRDYKKSLEKKVKKLEYSILNDILSQDEIKILKHSLKNTQNSLNEINNYLED